MKVQEKRTEMKQTTSQNNDKKTNDEAEEVTKKKKSRNNTKTVEMKLWTNYKTVKAKTISNGCIKKMSTL